MTNKKGFVTITNKEIYESIQQHNDKLDGIIDGIHKRLDVVEQKTAFNNKLVIGAYSFTTFVLGIVVTYFLK